MDFKNSKRYHLGFDMSNFKNFNIRLNESILSKFVSEEEPRTRKPLPLIINYQ